MRFVLHTDIDAGTTEHIVRVGSLINILDYTGEDYGFAVGRLTTADKYLAYSYADNRFRIRGADIATADESGVEVFRIWGTYEGGHAPGDFRFGPCVGRPPGVVVREPAPELLQRQRDHLLLARRNPVPEMLWSGTQPGPQIGIGELNGEGHIIARNSLDVAQFVVQNTVG